MKITCRMKEDGSFVILADDQPIGSSWNSDVSEIISGGFICSGGKTIFDDNAFVKKGLFGKNINFKKKMKDFANSTKFPSSEEIAEIQARITEIRNAFNSAITQTVEFTI